MKILVTTLALLLHVGLVNAQSNPELNVKVTGIKRVKGVIGVCLVQKAEEFRGNCENYKEYRVTANEMMVSFNNIRPGSYAVTVYHDANTNGQLDTNFIGLPKERYGFSNNPSTRFGPPSYKKCLFDMKSKKQIEIRLR